jgi:hypothetical protein
MNQTNETDELESLKRQNIFLREELGFAVNNYKKVRDSETAITKEAIELHKKYDSTITWMMLSWAITLAVITAHTLGLV